MSRFVVVAPAFNAEKTIDQFLLSLAAQSYDNWRLILIDDVSTDNTLHLVSSISARLGIGQQVTIIRNSEKKWEVANVLAGIRHPSTAPDDIICRIDPDDYLCDNDAFAIIDQVYEQSSCDALWTKHRWFDDKRLTNFNISAPMMTGADPYKHPWVSSHLKTFRRSVIDGIPYKNFLNMNGELVRRCGDQAVYLPVLKRARKAVHLPLVTYSYRCNLEPETFQTADAKFQAAEAEFIRQRGFVSEGEAWESAIFGTK